MSNIYNLYLTVQADRVRESLDEPTRETFDRKLRTLLADPYTKVSSAIGGDEHSRSVALTRNIAVDYTVNEGLLVVIVVHVVNLDHVLDEDDA